MIDVKKHFPERFGLIQILVPLILSVFLVVLAVPRVVANLMMVFPDTVFDHVQTAENPRHDTILKAIDRIEQALQWNQDNRYWFQIGSLFYELIGSDEYDDLENQEIARQAIEAYAMCLSQSPVEPDAWYLFAVSRFIINKYDKSLLDLVKNSIYTGRIVPDLMRDRLTFLSLYSEDLDDELKALAKDQVRLAWSIDPKGLVESVMEFPDLEPLVDNALDPEELELFREELEEAVSKS